METVSGAVLIVAYFVVSIFQYPIGQPVYKFLPFPTMQHCENYANMLKSNNQISTEYTLAINTQCMTQEEYDRALAERQRQLQQDNTTPGGK
jgi:hypothetical protein